jgi:hypothetical protein
MRQGAKWIEHNQERSAAYCRNQLATKNTKSHEKLHYFEVFVSRRVFCGDQKFAHAATISTVSGTMASKLRRVNDER